MENRLSFCVPIRLIGLVLIVCSTAAAQESRLLGVPAQIRAGETLRFTITLEPPPNFGGGFVGFALEGPGVTIQTSTAPWRSGQTSCAASFRIPEDAPGGQWRLHITGFDAGTKWRPLRSTDRTFDVIATKCLVFPSSAEVRINPSQAQLLRTAARVLQAQVQRFKAALAQHRNGPTEILDSIIHRNIAEAVKSLDATQLSFQEVGQPRKERDAEQTFFGDLRLSYMRLSTAMKGGRTEPTIGHGGASALILESAQTENSGPSIPILGQAALRPFEQNELAYKVVADTQSLTFDLVVSSSPEGASVCYHRRGDPCRPYADPTRTTIQSLPYAIWIVRFEKTGYRPVQREHDPFRDPNHEIDVQLQR